jgi:hypothetical protein
MAATYVPSRASDSSANAKPRSAGATSMASNDDKTPKSDTGYTPFGGRDHCSKCVHYEPPDSCEVVRGEIAAGGWCIFFQAK